MKAAIDNLKQKPKEQKTAVAGGIATAVVAILLIGWAIIYMKNVLNKGTGDLPADQVDFGALRQDREDAAAAMMGESREYGSGADPFDEAGNSSSFSF